MNHIEAIAHAQQAAEEQGYGWSETVGAHRYSIWPWPPFWRISSRMGENEIGATIVIINDENTHTRVYHVRPWAEYDVWRIVVFPLLLLAALGFVVTLVTRLIGFFFSSFGSLVPSSVLFALVGGLTLFSVPILRFLGKDTWFLRHEMRHLKPPATPRPEEEAAPEENVEEEQRSVDVESRPPGR